jgi:hypothetical protein
MEWNATPEDVASRLAGMDAGGPGSSPDAAPDAAAARLADLAAHLVALPHTELALVERSGVGFSLRARRGPDSSRPLFVLADLVHQAGAPPFLSVCFYAASVSDPDELGEIIPGGLLGEDGYCFDGEEVPAEYLEARMAEAHAQG